MGTEETVPTLKEVSLVIDSLKKQVASSRSLSVKVYCYDLDFVYVSAIAIVCVCVCALRWYNVSTAFGIFFEYRKGWRKTNRN